jgi:hypothetical protein
LVAATRFPATAVVLSAVTLIGYILDNSQSEAASMFFEYAWYALIGLLVLAAFAAALVLNIRYERARRRAEAKLTPEERKERDVRANAAKSWVWW